MGELDGVPGSDGERVRVPSMSHCIAPTADGFGIVGRRVCWPVIISIVKIGTWSVWLVIRPFCSISNAHVNEKTHEKKD
jgi:hypothetical protein